MRVLVLSADPSSPDTDAASASSILDELGCRVGVGRLDLADLHEADLEARPPAIVLVCAGGDLGRATRCRRILGTYASLAETPTLLLVEVERLSALDFAVGFDDFVLAPIVPAELHARLRQLDWKTAAFGSDEVIKIGDLVIDVAGYEVHLQGRPIEFTHQEFELLRFLAQHRGRVFTRDQLLSKVWGYDYSGSTRTVDIHIRRLRAKLGVQVGALIATVRNVGYKMRGAP